MRISLIVLIVGGFVSANAMAQSFVARPVDQGVGDLDRLSRSTRQLNHGLRSDGEQTSLFALPRAKVLQLQQLGGVQPLTDPTRTQAFYRMAPGVTAQMDQPHYMMPLKSFKSKKQEYAQNVSALRDGVFLEIIPANTVFILSPDMNQALTLAPGSAPGSNPGSRASGRISGVPPRNAALMGQRVDRRVNRRIDGRHQGRVMATRIENKITTRQIHSWNVRSR